MAKSDKGQDENDADEFFPDASVFRLVFLGLVVITPIMTPGMTSAFSSIALPQMNLTLDEASWFGSITMIACPFGSLFIGLIIDKYGRRISLLSSIVPSIAGWLLLADANASLTQLYIGRALTGFALGACLLPSPIYAAECITVNNVRIRSSVGTWSTFSMVTGGLLMYVFSVVLPYDKVALISALLSTLSLFLVLIFIPESPAWLYGKGRLRDARLAQSRLGIRQPILQNGETLPAVTPSPVIVGNNKARPKTDVHALKNLIHYLTRIGKREVYKPLAITITFLFLSEFSGLYCLVSYMVEVITVRPVDANPYVLSVVGQVIQIVGCLLLTFILPRSGVKTLSVASFLGVSIGFLVLAFSILVEDPSSSNVFNYLHVISIWAIMLAGNMGVLAIPYAILGEMFPMGSKGYASIPLLADSLFSFVVLKIFPYTFAQYKGVVFFVFSVICAAGAVFVATCLPETVGKTMDEIQKGFNKHRREKSAAGEEHWLQYSANAAADRNGNQESDSD